MTTTEEVIRLMEEAGLELNKTGWIEIHTQHLRKVFDLVRAEENEACAKDAHEFWIRNTDTSPAEAIRARRK